MKLATILLTFLMVQVAFMLAPRLAFCQTEKLDIIEYTPPKGWKETPKDGPKPEPGIKPGVKPLPPAPAVLPAPPVVAPAPIK